MFAGELLTQVILFIVGFRLVVLRGASRAPFVLY